MNASMRRLPDMCPCSAGTAFPSSRRLNLLPQGACGRTTLTNTALVVAAYANGGCTNPDNAAPGTLIYGGAFEPAARCYDVHNTLTINTGGFQYTGSVQTLCAKSSCSSGVLQLSLQFDDGTGQTIPCPTGELSAAGTRCRGSSCQTSAMCS